MSSQQILKIGDKTFHFSKLSPAAFRGLYVNLTRAQTSGFPLPHDEGVAILHPSGLLIEGPLRWGEELKEGTAAIQAAKDEEAKRPTHTLDPVTTQLPKQITPKK